ncbi:MAG: hypothetical protein JXR95_04605 [Deltaproteobacteria bacterium]|nr:hypothetical protein [Deltaproteobacteria bacterium]
MKSSGVLSSSENHLILEFFIRDALENLTPVSTDFIKNCTVESVSHEVIKTAGVKLTADVSRCEKTTQFREGFEYETLEYRDSGGACEALLRKNTEFEDTYTRESRYTIEAVSFLHPLNTSKPPVTVFENFQSYITDDEYDESVLDEQGEKAITDASKKKLFEKVALNCHRQPELEILDEIIDVESKKVSIQLELKNVVFGYEGKTYSLYFDDHQTIYGVGSLPAEVNLKEKLTDNAKKRDNYLFKKRALTGDFLRREKLSGFIILIAFLTLFFIPITFRDFQYVSLFRAIVALAVLSIVAAVPVYLTASRRMDHIMVDIDKKIMLLEEKNEKLKSQYITEVKAVYRSVS